MTVRSVSELAGQVGAMDRQACIRTLRTLPVRWMDFSDDWLTRQSLEHLQHVTMAACVRVLKTEGQVTLATGGQERRLGSWTARSSS